MKFLYITVLFLFVAFDKAQAQECSPPFIERDANGNLVNVDACQARYSINHVPRMALAGWQLEHQELQTVEAPQVTNELSSEAGGVLVWQLTYWRKDEDLIICRSAFVSVDAAPSSLHPICESAVTAEQISRARRLQ